jgi:hypothetical protein
MRLVGIALGIAAAAAAFGQSGQTLMLHPLMKDVVAPQAQVMWDVGNKAMDDDGKADASKLKPADWTALLAASQKMKDAASTVAAAQQIAVAPPGAKLQDEGAPGASTPKQIQGYIDANRGAFTDHAKKLAGVADDFYQAAKARDAVKLMDASSRLDEVCEACHTQFWYPEQTAK